MTVPTVFSSRRSLTRFFPLDSDSQVNALYTAFSNIQTAFDANVSNVMEEFRVAATDEKVQNILTKFLETLRASVLKIASPILTEELDEARLVEWNRTHAPQCERFCSLSAVVKAKHPLWAVDSSIIFTGEIESFKQLCDFFNYVAAVLIPVAAEITEEEAVSMVKVFQTCLTASFQDAEVSSAVSKCLRSKILESKGLIVTRLAKKSTAPAQRLAGEIIKFFEGIFPRVKPGGVEELPPLDAAQAQKFAEFKVPAETWSQAAQCAKTSGDVLFGKDIHMLQAFENVVSSLGAAHTLALSIFQPGVKYQQRACNEDNCKVIKKFILAVEDFKQARDVNVPGEDLTCAMLSCDHLHALFDWTQMAAAVSSLLEEQLHRYSTSWTADLQTFSRVISDNIVDITPYKDTFLQHDDVMQQLIANVDGFNKLPKACAAVRDAVTAVRKHLPRHERVVDKAAFSAARGLADQGIENVVYTMVAYYLKQDIAQAKNIVIIQRLTKEIREQAKGHHVPLTDEIKKRLDDLDSGAVAEEAPQEPNNVVPDAERAAQPQPLAKKWMPLRQPERAAQPEPPAEGAAQPEHTAKKRRFAGLKLA